MDPSKHLSALQERKKVKARHKPRMSLYRWLGQHQEDERRVTVKPDDKSDNRDTATKEVKDGFETATQNVVEPKISLNETKEYERYFSKKGS